MLDIGARSVSHRWGSCLDLGSTLVIRLVFKNICKAAPKDIDENKKLLISEYACGAWLLASRRGRRAEGGQRRRGVDLLIYFSDSHSWTQRGELSATHMPMTKQQPNLPLPVWAGQTQNDISQARKFRYKGTSEREKTDLELSLSLLGSTVWNFNVLRHWRVPVNQNWRKKTVSLNTGWLRVSAQ